MDNVWTDCSKRFTLSVVERGRSEEHSSLEPCWHLWHTVELEGESLEFTLLLPCGKYHMLFSVKRNLEGSEKSLLHFGVEREESMPSILSLLNVSF